MENKNLWIGLGVVLVLVAGFVYWSMNSTPALAPDTSDNGVVPTPVEDTTTGSVNVGSPAASISYENALIKYKNARLQLDKTCQASPDKMTFKNGAVIMVDNRAPVSRTVKVGSVFSIQAYGFKLVKLSSATLPTTWYVDCGTSQNVSSILIEK